MHSLSRAWLLSKRLEICAGSRTRLVIYARVLRDMAEQERAKAALSKGLLLARDLGDRRTCMTGLIEGAAIAWQEAIYASPRNSARAPRAYATPLPSRSSVESMTYTFEPLQQSVMRQRTMRSRSSGLREFGCDSMKLWHWRSRRFREIRKNRRSARASASKPGPS